MTERMHLRPWKPKGFQDGMQEFMQDIGFAQRRNTLRMEYKGARISLSFQETLQCCERLFAFRIRKENHPISGRILVRPDLISSLIGRFILTSVTDANNGVARHQASEVRVWLDEEPGWPPSPRCATRAKKSRWVRQEDAEFTTEIREFALSGGSAGRQTNGRSHPKVGILNSAPLRMPVGHREVMVFSRV